MPFNDNFNGTAGTKLTARTGWTKLGSGFGAQDPEINANNQLRAASSTDDVALIGQDAGGANHYVKATIYPGFAYGPGQNRTLMCVRSPNRGELYGLAYTSSSGQWQLVRDSNIVSSYTGTISAGGTEARVEAEGNKVTVYIDGVERMVADNLADHLTTTTVGIIVAGAPGADPVIDNWESGILVAPEPPTGARTSRTFDGQNVAYTFSTTGDPTSGSFTLTATGNGAVTQGPKALTINNTTDTATVSFDAVPAGDYSETGTVAGPGGVSGITGTSSFTIQSIGGNPVDPGDTGTTPTVTSVTVSPSTATGATDFDAMVAGTNSPSQSVTWSTTAGSIDSNGVFTPPAATNVVQNITVTATSVLDPTKSGTAAVTIAAVENPTVTSVVVSPGTATGSTTFSAVVNGTNSPSQAVTWSASAGTINSSGAFTAPAATNVTQNITITATSVQDNTKSGTASVTIAALNSTVTGVSVSPSTATGSANFSATVSGTNSPSQSVNWSASAGTINASGVFTAPAASNVVQTITITATSAQDPTKSGTATVTIAALVQTVTSVTVSPSVGSIDSLGTLQFTATVAGANSPPQSVTWSVTAGSISGSGMFTAPVVQDDQEVNVTATSTFDPSKSGSALVTVNPIPDVVYELEPEPPSVIVRTGLSDRLRLSLTFTDSPAPRGRTVTIGGSSTTITSG